MATDQHSGILRQVSSPNTGGIPKIIPLSADQDIVLGRSPDCQVVIDSQQYSRVSRRHAVIQPLQNGGATQANPTWQICDLNSANGTFINGQRLHHCQALHIGDRILLGQDGPQFIFEYRPAASSSPAYARATPLNYPAPAHDIPSLTSPPPINSELSVSQLLPIVSARKDLLKKGYLIPGALTVVLVVALFVAQNSRIFNPLLASYLGIGALFFIYRSCGKTKPWWVMGACAVMTITILLTPMLSLFIFVFRFLLPGNALAEDAGFIPQLISNFFGAGLMEELLKALPVFFFLFLGTLAANPMRKRIGVWEPLDGILLAAASALGFTWLETLGQYVPSVMETDGDLAGLQLLIPRILGSVAGHMAYSGYFGYFIGLSILKPSKRWQILGIGYFTSSLLHAFWNASAVGLRNQFGPLVGVIGLMVVGVVSYAFLMAAIIKARQLSPTRAQNFATRVVPPS